MRWTGQDKVNLIGTTIANDEAKASFAPTPPPTSTDKGNGANTRNTDQSDYASKYDTMASKPTMVSINIGNVANFDKMTVVSGAEERDLMMAMETRIADAVYRIFAEAANNANHAMSNMA